MDVCLRVSVLCCPVFRQRPSVGLIPQPRSPIERIVLFDFIHRLVPQKLRN
jgi:hypothetical protein